MHKLISANKTNTNWADGLVLFFYITKRTLSVCQSGCSLATATVLKIQVWSSPNDSKCVRLGVSVLKISNLPKPEVELWKNVKSRRDLQLGVVLWVSPWMHILLGCKGSTFFLCIMKVHVKGFLWTEVWLIQVVTMQYPTQRLITDLLI